MMPTQQVVAMGQDPKCARCCPYDCDVAVIDMVQDEHSAAPFEGFDLRRIPPSDGELVSLAMSAFDIDPDAPDARQQLHRELRHKRRRGRNGRRPDFFRIAVAMELEGVTPSDTAEMIAERIERYFPNLTDASQVQKAERWLREYRERSEATTP